MKPISDIKKDLSRSMDLKYIIDTLKLVSSSEFGRLFSILPKKATVNENILDCIGMLSGQAKENIFFSEKNNLPEAILLVCSDEGFLGEMNIRIVSKAIDFAKGKGIKFLVIGERGAEVLKEYDKECIILPSVGQNVEVDYVRRITERMVKLYKRGDIGILYAMYMRFNSFTNQEIETVKLLPCSEETTDTGNDPKEVLIEPGLNSVAGYLAKIWLEDSLFNIFWSSKLSEWAIRVIRLEKSSEELKEMTEKLRHGYFKAIHEHSDRVIGEIFAAKKITQ